MADGIKKKTAKAKTEKQRRLAEAKLTSSADHESSPQDAPSDGLLTAAGSVMTAVTPETSTSNVTAILNTQAVFEPIKVNRLEMSRALQNISDLLSIHGAFMRYHLQTMSAMNGYAGFETAPALIGPGPSSLSNISKLHQLQIQAELHKLSASFQIDTVIIDYDSNPPASFDTHSHGLQALDVLQQDAMFSGEFVNFEQSIAQLSLNDPRLQVEGVANYMDIVDMTQVLNPVQIGNTAAVPVESLSVPTFNQTPTQLKTWKTCRSHYTRTLFAIAPSKNGGFPNIGKIKGMLFTTHMLPKSAKACDVNDPKAAKRCNSLHLTGYFAGMTLYLSHTFNSCPSCTSGKYLTTIDVILEDRTIVANLHPDFACDILGYIRLQKSQAISKHGKIIGPGQAVRGGIDKFNAERFLGLNWEAIKKLGGTYKGVRDGDHLLDQSTLKMTSSGRTFYANRFLPRASRESQTSEQGSPAAAASSKAQGTSRSRSKRSSAVATTDAAPKRPKTAEPAPGLADGCDTDTMSTTPYDYQVGL